MSQQYSRKSFKEFAEQTYQSETTKSLTFYALGSYLEVLNREPDIVGQDDCLRLWVASMLISGLKLSTCERYFGKVRSIYNMYSKLCGSTNDDNPFISFIPSWNTISSTNRREMTDNSARVKRLLYKNDRSDEWQTIAIFLYLLYFPASTINDIVNLTFASVQRFCPQIDDIINTQDSSRGRKYVFSLKQGKSRPKEIERRLIRILSDLAASVGMKFEFNFSRESITALWITAALEAKVSLQDIRSVIGSVPMEYSSLILIRKQEFDSERRAQIICRVADTINSYATHWFVMKLRHHATVDDIKRRINETLPGRLQSMLFFYPTRTVVRKDEGRRISEELPYLPDILFFKTQKSKIRSLFANIGDLSWCFRVSNTPDSEYSIISNKQMQVFQQCIGQFSPDIHLELVDMSRPVQIGRMVKIVGGIMEGYEGEILDVEGEPGKRTFFLSLTNAQGIKWDARVEDVFIQPLN